MRDAEPETVSSDHEVERPSDLWHLMLGEVVLLGALVASPSFFMAAAVAVWLFYRGRRSGLEAWLLVLTQVGLTASYGSQRAMALFQIAGLSFTPVDIFALVAVAAGLVTAQSAFRDGSRLTKQLVSRMFALCIFMVIPMTVAWGLYPGTTAVALRNLRSFLYLVAVIAYAGAVLRNHLAGSRFVTAMNLAAAGAAVVQLGQALGLFQVIGFEERTFLLDPSELVRLSILPETLVPAFVAAAATSVMFLTGAPRRSGLIAMPLLAASLVVSPGRGAIFASVFVITALLILSFRRGRTRLTPGEGRSSRALQVGIVGGSAAIAIVLAISGLTTKQEQVLRDRLVEGVAPWTTHDVVGRTNGWRAGLEMGLRSPLLGTGLGTRFPDLKVKHHLDSDFNFPGTLPNTFAKTGIIGLLLLGSLLALAWAEGWRAWRTRSTRTALVAGPIVLALLLRSLSDDVSQGFEFPIVLGVVFAALSGAVAQTPPNARNEARSPALVRPSSSP